jgi:hypothetical protein
MNGATTTNARGAEGLELPAVGQGRGRRLRRRHLWLIPGLAIAIAANMLGEANGVGILALIAFGIAPDLPRLLGSRGRPIHNVLHQPLLAGAAAATAIVLVPIGVLPTFWLVGALVWVGHVVAGWGVGDVPRGGVRPHA